MLNSLVKFFLNPFNVIWISVLAAGVAYFFKSEKLCSYFFTLAGLVFLISSNFLLPNFLMSKLEENFTPFTLKSYNDSTAYNIVVLGAGFSDNNKLPYNDQLSSTALSRLIEGIRIYKLFPKSKLIVSGPGFDGGITHAEVYSKTASSLVIDSNSTYVIKTALNTREEAKLYAEKFGKETPVILVTSASHMPRAMMMFNLHGIAPIPAPTDFQIKGGEKARTSWLPSMENMNKMRLALIEYVGIWHAKLFLL